MNRAVPMPALFFATLTVLVLSVDAGSHELTYRVVSSSSDLNIQQVKGYDLVSLPEASFLTRSGEPMLPAKVVFVALPQGMTVEEVEVIFRREEKLPGRYSILPVQPSQPISRRQSLDFIEPIPSVYADTAPYPERLVEYVGSGSLSGHRVAGLRVFPLRYIPAEERLVFCREIGFTLHLVLDDDPPPPIAVRTRRAEELFVQSVKNRVINPEDVGGQVAETIVEHTPKNDLVEYLIITYPNFASAFEELAEWKTRKGIPADVMTTDSIYANPAYDGHDDQEEIRNCIKDYWLNRGTVWVLLGGDVVYVPVREAYAYYDDPDDPLFPQYSEYIPCDLYYADLDGTWDPDGDHTYGEPCSSIDMYADVYLGRAPIATHSDIGPFIEKILTYEGVGTDPLPTDYQHRILFIGEQLWPDHYGGDAKDLIDDQYVPADYTITKLYERDGTLNKIAVRNILNSGQNMVNNDCHGFTSVISLGGGEWSTLDMDDLSNGPRFSGLWYSISCYVGHLMGNCIAERWVRNAHGGGVGFIGNSLYGWGMPGSPGYGPSDTFDNEFFQALFSDGYHQLGQIHAEAKNDNVPSCRGIGKNPYRYCLYELNLFGDPELPIWTDTPDSFNITHPTTVTLGESTSFTIVVYTKTGAPVRDAYICLYKEDDIYLTGTTDNAGSKTFTIAPATAGQLSITVTNRNYIPYVGSAMAVKDNEFVRGDATADGVINVFDGLRVVYWLGGRADPPPCLQAADATDDEFVDIFDGARIVGSLVGQADPPPEPCCEIPSDCGADPTPGPLPCDSYPPCGPAGEVVPNFIAVGQTQRSRLVVGEALLQEGAIPVPVSLSNAEPLVGFSWTVEYDPELLAARVVDIAGLITEKFDVFASDVREHGLIKVAAVSDMDVANGVEALPPGEHQVATIIFEVGGRSMSRDAPLKVTNSIMAMDHHRALNHHRVDGMVKTTPSSPTAFCLRQNFPNPFNPTTTIRYALPMACQVNLEIFNILGQREITLVDEFQGAGYKTARWDGRNERGETVVSGIYIYRLRAGKAMATGKAVLLR